MAAMQMTYRIAHAAAWDAGDASMRAGNRAKWNIDDYNVMVRKFNELWPIGSERVENVHH